MKISRHSKFWPTILLYSLLSLQLPGTTIAVSTKKFVSWFPLLSRPTYEDVSETECHVRLSQYRESLKTDNVTDHAATCSRQQACILGALREDIKSRMASASVLLGLTPGLLASIGPSVTETAVLSTEKPLLSMLISMGSPAVYPSRVLTYEDARELLRMQPYQGFSRIRSSKFLSSTTFIFLEYLLLCTAAANVFYTSFELGTKTVVSFRCINYTLPLVWSVLALGIHLVTSLSFYTKFGHFWDPRNLITRKKRSNSSDTLPNTNLSIIHSNTSGKQSYRPINRNLEAEDRIKPSDRSIIMTYIATCLGFLHIVFGSMVFSSLLFIELLDVGTVILRYVASTVLSRAILMFELDQIRRKRQHDFQQNQFRHGPVLRTDSTELQTLVPPKDPISKNAIARKPIVRGNTDDLSS